MELENLSCFAVLSSLEQHQIIPSHTMTSRIDQLPIPWLLKQHLKTCCVKWSLQPILTKFTFEFTRTIDVPRQVEFNVYGFYGICGLFYDKKTKLLLEIQQNDCQEISVWCIASGHLMKNDFRQKACAILRDLGVSVSLGDFKSRCYGKIIMQFNREMVLMEWKGDENDNWLDDILHWRNSAVRHSTIKLKLPSSQGQMKLLSVFPVGCESELPPAEVSREFSLLDGITCEDAQRLQGIFYLCDRHIFTKLLEEASECDKM